MDPQNLLPKMDPTSTGMKSFGPFRTSRTSPYPRVNVEAIRAERNADTIRSLAISTSHVKYITPAQCEILSQSGYVCQGKRLL